MQIHDVNSEGVERTSAEGLKAAGARPLHHCGSDCVLASRLSACIRVNGGHFEHKFCSYDFLMCFICFSDSGISKFVQYKHKQSANNVQNALLLCPGL